jgi:hypothetical protein
MEISMAVPQKIKNRTTVWILVCRFWAYIQRSIIQYTKEIIANPCLLQYYSQESSYGISIGAQEHMNGSNGDTQIHIHTHTMV